MGVRYWLAGLVCAIAPVTSVQGEVVTVRPSSDRDGTSQVSPDAGSFALRPDGLGALIVGSGMGGGFYRSALEFSLAGVLPTVTDAKLSFHGELVQNPPAAYRTHGYVGDGVVTAEDLSVSYEIAPIQTTPSSLADPLVVDVTSFVQSLISQDASYAGFTLSGFAGGHGFSFTSGEPYVNSPLLSITSVPEPTAGLAVLLLSALSCSRRTRRVHA